MAGIVGNIVYPAARSIGALIGELLMLPVRPFELAHGLLFPLGASPDDSLANVLHFFKANAFWTCGSAVLLVLALSASRETRGLLEWLAEYPGRIVYGAHSALAVAGSLANRDVVVPRATVGLIAAGPLTLYALYPMVKRLSISTRDRAANFIMHAAGSLACFNLAKMNSADGYSAIAWSFRASSFMLALTAAAQLPGLREVAQRTAQLVERSVGRAARFLLRVVAPKVARFAARVWHFVYDLAPLRWLRARLWQLMMLIEPHLARAFRRLWDAVSPCVLPAACGAVGVALAGAAVDLWRASLAAFDAGTYGGGVRMLLAAASPRLALLGLTATAVTGVGAMLSLHALCDYGVLRPPTQSRVGRRAVRVARLLMSPLTTGRLLRALERVLDAAFRVVEAIGRWISANPAQTMALVLAANTGAVIYLVRTGQSALLPGVSELLGRAWAAVVEHVAAAHALSVEGALQSQWLALVCVASAALATKHIDEAAATVEAVRHHDQARQHAVQLREWAAIVSFARSSAKAALLPTAALLLTRQAAHAVGLSMETASSAGLTLTLVYVAGWLRYGLLHVAWDVRQARRAEARHQEQQARARRDAAAQRQAGVQSLQRLYAELDSSRLRPRQVFLTAEDACGICFEDYAVEAEAEAQGRAQDGAQQRQQPTAAPTREALEAILALEPVQDRVAALRAAGICVLPCGHVYHGACFWEYWQSLPTQTQRVCAFCRRPVLLQGAALQNLFH